MCGAPRALSYPTLQQRRMDSGFASALITPNHLGHHDGVKFEPVRAQLTAPKDYNLHHSDRIEFPGYPTACYLPAIGRKTGIRSCQARQTRKPSSRRKDKLDP